MAIMLIIVSRAARHRSAAAATATESRYQLPFLLFSRGGNGVCHHYGERLTVNARYSFPARKTLKEPVRCWRGGERGVGRRVERKEGRTSEPEVHV